MNAWPELAFDSPWYLVLLALVPLVWWWGRRSLAGLPPVRRAMVRLLRTAVLVTLILAAAEMQWVQRSDRLTVIYVLDQSLSIPLERRLGMVDFVNATVAAHRQDRDRVGVIVFGRDAMVELPPFDESVPLPRTVESRLNAEYTNLAGALKLAMASFPEDSAKRVVVVSDGNENLGDALEQAALAADATVGIDVFPIVYGARSEVAIEKVVLPGDIRKGQAFDLRVVVDNSTLAADGGDGAVRGRIILSQRTDDQPIVLDEREVSLPPGKSVFTLRQQLDEPSFYTYEARFVPDDPTSDAMSQNNRAHAFTHVRGSGQVLLIEDRDTPGEHERFVAALRRDNLEVTVRPSDQAFGTLGELQPYDTVVLANVPREQMTDDQITILAENTHALGCGMIMLGGPNSFGAGGWANTAVEEAMPVDFQIKSMKVLPSGALALVIDRSGSMSGEKLELSKKAAVAAVKVLGPNDQVGVVAFDDGAFTVVPMQPVKSSSRIISMIGGIHEGGGTDMYPGMEEAYKALRGAKSAMKHMIVLTDGHTNDRGFDDLVRAMVKDKITVSTVAIGIDSAAPLLSRIAALGGGKFYAVNDPRGVPRIFMQEARRVARPLMYEDPKGFVPQLRYPHEIMAGVEAPLPPLTGFVMSTVKQNPLVEVAIVSPVPDVPENNTILAAWTYGLGKTVAFASDTGSRWTAAWTQWSGYDKVFSQMTRWSMRPTGDTGKYNLATDVVDGRLRVVVSALDEENEFLNFLDLVGGVVGPDMKSRPLRLEQTAPGRYMGSIPVDEAGSYFVSLSPGGGQAPLRTGVNVPYSSEFRAQVSNLALLERLAAMQPKGGVEGQMIDADSAAPLAVNSFRHDLPQAFRMLDIWPQLLWFAAIVFFADVFTRRVSLNLGWVPPLTARVKNRLLGRDAVAAVQPTMDRLRSRKQEISRALDERRATTRFEPSPGPATDAAIAELPASSAASPPVAPPSRAITPEKPPEESYTDRLLKAKKKVWEEKQ